MAVRNEAEAQERFSGRYGAPVLPTAIAVERAALGSDYGGSGFTTIAQADLLASSLEVGAGDQVLDLGSGCGWPGLHIAARTGCDVVLADLTVSGMRRGLVRARNDGLSAQVRAVAASARELPFRPDSFDAMVHTDVLC